MGQLTQRMLAVIFVGLVVLAVAAAVPWLDFHTVRLAGYDGLVVSRFEDGWLVALFAIPAAVSARWMMRRPSELAWALLVVSCSAVFVFAASDLSTGHECPSNILSMLGYLGCPPYGEHTRWLLGADISVFSWTFTIGSMLIALFALALPIIEVSDRFEALERE